MEITTTNNPYEDCYRYLFREFDLFPKWDCQDFGKVTKALDALPKPDSKEKIEQLRNSRLAKSFPRLAAKFGKEVYEEDELVVVQ